jgi:hypothetical protein
MSERDERETVAGATAEARYGDAVRALVTTLMPGADDATAEGVLAEAARAAADAPDGTRDTAPKKPADDQRDQHLHPAHSVPPSGSRSRVYLRHRRAHNPGLFRARIP